MDFPRDSLVELLPPPEHPVDNQGDWAQVEQQLGTSLPTDYKWFIETYGRGYICRDFVCVLNPFAENQTPDYLKYCEGTLDWLRKEQESSELRFNPHPVFPQPGGILPWGTSGNGHDMFWLTQGEPDTWRIVFHDRDRIEVRVYDQTCLTQFLVTLLSGQMDGGKFKIPTWMFQHQPRFRRPCDFPTPEERKEERRKWKEEKWKEESQAAAKTLKKPHLASSNKHDVIPPDAPFPAAELIKLLPPTDDPVENQGSWAQVEQRLGITLPADYKWFIETYGTGTICDGCVRVLNPFAKNAALNLLECGERILEWYTTDKGDSEFRLNHFPIYPEPGGILPWATSAYGVTMFWLTTGEPDNWSILFQELEGTGCRVYEKTSVTQFLVTLLSGRREEGTFEIPDGDLQDRLKTKTPAMYRNRRWRTSDPGLTSGSETLDCAAVPDRLNHARRDALPQQSQFPAEELLRLLPPPETPIKHAGDWAQVEQQLGTALPDDYKWFIETYGSGGICKNFIVVLNPFAKRDATNLLVGGERMIKPYRKIEGKPVNEHNPHPVYPEPGGILPWGFSSCGHEMLWLTRGEPNTWCVVFHDTDRVESRLYENTCMTQFLVTLLSGSLDGGRFQIPDRHLNFSPQFSIPRIDLED